jgi:hypothetical protein
VQEREVVALGVRRVLGHGLLVGELRAHVARVGTAVGPARLRVVHVRVDEARREEPARDVDDLGSGGDRRGRAWAHRGDHPVRHEHDGVRNRRCVVARVDGGADERERLLCRARREEQGEDGEQQRGVAAGHGAIMLAATLLRESRVRSQLMDGAARLLRSRCSTTVLLRSCGGAMRKRPSGKAHSFGGDWTTTKLDVLAEYLRSYTTALKDKPSKEHPFAKAYIDAFAGPVTERLDKE